MMNALSNLRRFFSLLTVGLLLANMLLLFPAVAEASAYDSADRLTDPAVSYDENGNLLDDGTTAYIYDTANRLVQTATGSDTNAYTYDGRGNLVEINENGTATELVLNENTPYPTILGEIQGATPRSYAYGMGLHAQKTGGAVAYPLLDHQGTIRHMTDVAGAVTHSRYYNAWGETRHTTGGTGPTLGYTGEREMADGTVYLRARAYQPRMGKMVQRDSIDPAFYGRGAQGHNRYSYVENNPVNYVDPSGHLVGGPEDLEAGQAAGGTVSAGVSGPARGGRGTVGVAPMGRGMGSPGVPNYAPRPAALPLNNPTTVPPMIFTPNRNQPASVPRLPKPGINPSNSPLPGLSDDPTEDWLRDLSKKYGNGGRFCSARPFDRPFYHGSSDKHYDSLAEKIRPSKSDSLKYGPGFYATPDYKLARKYAEQTAKRAGGSPRVYTVRVEPEIPRIRLKRVGYDFLPHVRKRDSVYDDAMNNYDGLITPEGIKFNPHFVDGGGISVWGTDEPLTDR